MSNHRLWVPEKKFNVIETKVNVQASVVMMDRAAVIDRFIEAERDRFTLDNIREFIKQNIENDALPGNGYSENDQVEDTLIGIFWVLNKAYYKDSVTCANEEERIKRHSMIEYAAAFIGMIYRYKGDDPLGGFDCSGFVCEILKSVGILRESERLSADMMYKRYKKYDRGIAGDLAFLIDDKDKAYHVGLLIGNGLLIQAGGGDSQTDTLQESIDQNAFVKIRPVWKSAVFCNPFNGR